MSRQLAAILFSDIVGYTRLMGENEQATLELVRKNREIQQPLVEKHHGIWLKEMGDGVMARFNSALDAVRCAVEIQEIVAKELEAQIRIGIHLGDITVENGEVYGDGINLASRIESIAVPGSIFISGAVHGAIKGSDIHTLYQGVKRLKNVDRPIKVYQIVEEAPPLTVSPLKQYMYWIIGILLLVGFSIWKLTQSEESIAGRTIAVLPLKMESADSTNQYLVEGITQELVHSLGKIQELTVVNSISTMRFMASIAPIQQASNELEESDFFLSGTLSENNKALEMELGLYDHQQQEIWSGTYSGDLYELPKLAGTIAVDLAEFIKVSLSEIEASRIVDIRTGGSRNFSINVIGKKPPVQVYPARYRHRY